MLAQAEQVRLEIYQPPEDNELDVLLNMREKLDDRIRQLREQQHLRDCDRVLDLLAPVVMFAGQFTSAQCAHAMDGRQGTQGCQGAQSGERFSAAMAGAQGETYTGSTGMTGGTGSGGPAGATPFTDVFVVSRFSKRSHLPARTSSLARSIIGHRK